MRPASLANLVHLDDIAAHVLAAHGHDIGAAPSREQQQRESEPRLRADRMMRLELRDLFFDPRVDSGRPGADGLDLGGRVVGAHAFLDGDRHQHLD